MSYTILIAGPDDLLAVHISALELARTAGSSICRTTSQGQAEGFLRGVQEHYRMLASGNSTEADSKARVHVIATPSDSIDPILQAGIRAEKAWYLLPTRRDLKIDGQPFPRFVGALPQAGVGELNLVLPALPKRPNDEDGRHQTFVDGIVQQCRAQNIGWRIFQTSLIVGSAKDGPNDHDLVWFLDVLHDLKQEITSRAPDYFGFEALRLLASPEAALNLISADYASRLMTQIAAREDTLNCVYDIAAPENVPFMDICEQIGSAYEFGLLPVEDESELNAIDRLFMRRTEAFHQYLEALPEFASEKSYGLAGLSSQGAVLDQASQLEFFTAIRQKQNEEREARSKRIAMLPGQLRQKTIVRNGFNLTYYGGGQAGIPILILNALGQGLEYWYPLLEQIIPKHAVLIWEPQGTLSPPPPFGLKEQVDDAQSILHEEGIKKCHIIGWCTGPKLAVELYVRSPETVQSMVFLNSQFKCPGTPRNLVTAYEYNIEPLFRVLEKNPRTAPAVMNSLKTTVGAGAINLVGQADSKKLGTDVLSLMNQDLKGLVLSPFQSEESTVNYAHQIIDFWSYDTLAKAGEVKVPILMIAAEFDQVASPAMSREARHRFPQVTHVEVQGANHYLLYDRPGFVAQLITDFLEQMDRQTARANI